MLRTLDSLEAALQAHSFRVFLFGVAGLVLVRSLAWFLDRPLRAHAGAGYASDAQLTVLGVGAMAANLSMRVWLPEAFAQGLLVAVAATAVAGVAIHRAAHPPVAVALGSVFQAVGLPDGMGGGGCVGGLQLILRARRESEEEVDRKRHSDLRQTEEEKAGRWAYDEQAKAQARNPRPQMGEWPF